MAETPEVQIVDAVEARLNTITVGAGYRNTIRKVLRVEKGHEELGSEEVPALILATARAPVQIPAYRTARRMRMALFLDVFGIAAGLPGRAIHKALSDLDDDVIRAMHLDHTWGLLAISTLLVAGPVKTDADAEAKHKGGRGATLMTWRIDYDRAAGGSP